MCTCGGQGAILQTNDGQASNVTKLRWSDAWCALVVEREQSYIQMMVKLQKSQSYVGVTPGVHLWWKGSSVSLVL